jgi:Protein of unknown function (DUF2914)
MNTAGIFRKIVSLAHNHETLFSAIFFSVGFLWDLLTLWRPDGIYENTVFLAYLITATSCIVALHLVEKKGEERALLLAVTHFCLGSLVGELIILYGRSGTLEGSFIFFTIGAAFLLAHELFRGKYKSQLLRISVWYSILCMYAALTLPIIYGRMDDSVFNHALITSFICAFVFLLTLRLLNLIQTERDFYFAIGSTLVITAFFSISYATHILPPVPIALKTAGIYHSIKKERGSYTATFEKPYISFPLETSTEFHTETPSKLYCFSSVFAPSKLQTEIMHSWEMYLPNNKQWVSVIDIPFPISGGREEGYRGYSYISIHQKGWYRCSITTGNGTLIGRRQVNVLEGNPILETKIY